jgi:phosphotriesterase-related protein
MFYQADSFLFTQDEGALFERFLMELQVGVQDGGSRLSVRAGAVKAALGPEGPVGRDESLLRAAARAAAAGDVPLLVHTEAGAGAVKAVALSERMGLAPCRVMVCHADRQADDFRPHDEIAATGAYLEYDTISRFKYHDDASEIRLILHMLERGHRDRLLLSLDTTAARLRHYGGEIGLTRLIETFLPALARAGVSPADLSVITRQNPARAFAGPA